jgi:hypothetical protein
MAHIERINWTDSVPDAVAKIAEGNIRAAVLYGPDETLRRNRPFELPKVIGPVMLLDSLGIYGPNVWVIFKDVCEQNHARMLAVLRATQLGMLSSADCGGFKQAVQEMKGKEKNNRRCRIIFQTFLKTSLTPTGPIYIDEPQGPVTKQLQNYKGL